MLKTGCLLALLLAAIPASAGVIPDRVETGLRDRIAAGQLPSAMVAMIQDGQVVLESFGTLPSGKAPDADTLYEIGSVTKTFTATLLAEAVQKGEVRLDEPVRELLPGFTVPSRGGREITLADIAEQHSGLPRIPDNFRPHDEADPYADFGAAELKAFLAGYTLRRDPGASYEYSNLAVGMLGYALAETRHQSYEALVAERVFQPLGMTSSAVTLGPALLARLTPGFSDEGKPARHWTFSAMAAAGAISSSATDMLRYVRAYMGNSASPLRAAMDLAIQPRRPVDNQQIGLIWMRLPLSDGRTLIWHNGMTGGYASFVGFTADGRTGLVILTNRAQSVSDLGIAAVDPGAPLAAAHKTISLSATQLAPLAGTYKLRDKFFLTVTPAENTLILRTTGHPSFPVYPSGGTDFFSPLDDVSVSFTQTGLVLHRESDHPAPRVTDWDAAAELGAIKPDPVTLAAYRGRYALTPAVSLEIEPGPDRLMARVTGQEAAPLFASAPDRFFSLAADAEIDFQRDAAGAVTGLILRQGGNTLSVQRIASP